MENKDFYDKLAKLTENWFKELANSTSHLIKFCYDKSLSSDKEADKIVDNLRVCRREILSLIKYQSNLDRIDCPYDKILKVVVDEIQGVASLLKGIDVRVRFDFVHETIKMTLFFDIKGNGMFKFNDKFYSLKKKELKDFYKSAAMSNIPIDAKMFFGAVSDFIRLKGYPPRYHRYDVDIKGNMKLQEVKK